jgi:hypothetical protein
MIQWILEHLGIVVVVVLFIVQMIRGVLEQAKNRQPRPMQRDAGDEERRTREVQEQIRRQIAARRAAQNQPEAPPVLQREQETPPTARPETTQMPAPFGEGPLGRMLEELQRKAQQHLPTPPPPAPPVVQERRHLAEIERQQRLADELKALEEARHVAQRRAAHVAADRLAVIESEPAMRSVARKRLLDDLDGAESLRRAFVLKEVLGTPVGLR